MNKWIMNKTEYLLMAVILLFCLLKFEADLINIL